MSTLFQCSGVPDRVSGMSKLIQCSGMPDRASSMSTLFQCSGVPDWASSMITLFQCSGVPDRASGMSILFQCSGVPDKASSMSTLFQCSGVPDRASRISTLFQCSGVPDRASGAALTWWNGHVRTLGHDAAYAMTWGTLKKKLTEKYCPKDEIKKLQIKLWNLKVRGNDVAAYTQCFQELSLMCTKYLANETKKVDKYICGLPDNIHGNIMFARPKTLDEAIELANDLMDQKLRTYAERQTKTRFVEQPVEIMDREIKKLKRSRIPIIKISWNSKRGPEFTWEREEQFK
nr:reverse transcriptase domain-containing protein [Tanacetum cinerariifolium]